MKFTIQIVFSLLLVGVFADITPPSESTPTSDISTSTIVTTKAPVPTTKSTPETTTPKSTPETTTPKSTPETTTPKSTPETTTTTTPKPTPETTSPKTTTPKPTPETTTPKTTPTPAPVTTTAGPPTPEEGAWNVTDGNTTCIRAVLKILFKFPINGVERYYALSPNATKSGSNCNDTDGTQLLELDDGIYRFSLTFKRDGGNVFVQNTTFIYSSQRVQEEFRNNTRFYTVKTGNSYMCAVEVSVDLENATMEVQKIHLQAFGAEGNDNFGEEEECAADNPVSDVVPIAVGIALLALVVVVLIAYLVGRRRNRQKGYQSV